MGDYRDGRTTVAKYLVDYMLVSCRGTVVLVSSLD
jgi:hypothetical protein